MGILLLLANVFLQQGETMIVRRYGRKYRGGMLFNSIICLFAVVFFLLTDKGGLCFPKEIFWYGAVSCIMFATGFYSMHLAMQWGSYVASKMIASFSGVISIIYGIFFLKEPADLLTYIAIALIFLSIVLMNGKKDENGEKGFSVKWLIAVLITAVSNGFIAVISRMQQIHFSQAYDNEFMVLSFGGSFVLLAILALICQRDSLREIAKYGTAYGALAGMFNGAKNLATLVLYLYIPISVATPLRTGADMVLSFMVSVILYREKFTKRQLASVIVGMVALVLFNL